MESLQETQNNPTAVETAEVDGTVKQKVNEEDNDEEEWLQYEPEEEDTIEFDEETRLAMKASMLNIANRGNRGFKPKGKLHAIARTILLVSLYLVIRSFMIFDVCSFRI